MYGSGQSEDHVVCLLSPLAGTLVLTLASFSGGALGGGRGVFDLCQSTHLPAVLRGTQGCESCGDAGVRQTCIAPGGH